MVNPPWIHLTKNKSKNLVMFQHVTRAIKSCCTMAIYLKQNQSISGRASEIISVDQYRVYEIFICEYDIKGKIDSHIRLLTTGKPSQFKLWGFEIHKAEIGEKIPDIRMSTKNVKGWWTFGVPPH
jgi:hypothetical protein